MAVRVWGLVVPADGGEGYVPEGDSAYYDDALEAWEDAVEVTTVQAEDMGWTVPDLSPLWAALDNGESCRVLVGVYDDGDHHYVCCETVPDRD